MGFLVSVTAAFVVWIVVWALTAKGFDAFMITAAILVVGVTGKIVAGYLPGRRA